MIIQDKEKQLPKVNHKYLKYYLQGISINEFGHDVFINSRKKELVFQRMSAMYAVFNNLHIDMRNIGLVCSNGKQKDHSTVHYAIKTVRRERKDYKDHGRYKDREDSVLFWTNEIYKLLSIKESVHSPIRKLIKRIKENLLMNENELITITDIEIIIDSHIDKMKHNIFSL